MGAGKTGRTGNGLKLCLPILNPTVLLYDAEKTEGRQMFSMLPDERLHRLSELLLINLSLH